MKTALVIMAAGLGSRFGGGLKQLAPVGANGEIIMDFSIHDAIEAGFDKILFIIRREIEEEFRQVIGTRIEALCARLGVEVGYAFQSLNDLPEGVSLPPERRKPWGTGQAVLSCRGMLQEPFAVINADDYYGKEAFVRLHSFLEQYSPREPRRFCMAGFVLRNTLSENGGVTRGICRMDASGYLTGVHETRNILCVRRDGQIFAEAEGKSIDPDSLVSMNMWGLTPEFLSILEQGFASFFEELDPESPEALKAEYLLPNCIDRLLQADQAQVQVLKTHDRWFGVTYQEDRETVIESFRELIRQGVYRKDLFSDLKR